MSCLCQSPCQSHICGLMTVVRGEPAGFEDGIFAAPENGLVLWVVAEAVAIRRDRVIALGLLAMGTKRGRKENLDPLTFSIILRATYSIGIVLFPTHG